MTLRSDILSKSVTKDDHPTDAGRRGAVFSYYIGSPLMGGLVSLPPDPPRYWSFQRDTILRNTIHAESQWADAVYIAITKLASLSWDVKGDVPLRVKRAQELLSMADDEMGWVQFIQKHAADFFLTDNGAFFEIIRDSSAAGSRITGIMPLDSQRCIRTGDPDIPVIYRDRINAYHEMKYWQVVMMSDMPNPAELYWGVGFCAASRAYKSIRKLSALEAYVTEKITGQRPLSLNFVSNISQNQIDEAIDAAKEQAAALGRSVYMGAVIVANIDPTAAAGVSTIDLAGLPDGFEATTERNAGQLVYANALGLDPQDINPALLASKALGTGAQSAVIDAKASGKGTVSYRQQLIHKLDWEVLDDRTSFYLHERDLRDEKMRADIGYVLAQTNDLRIKNQSITPREARQLDVDADLLPAEFEPKDFTPTTTLSDTDKPVKAELQGMGGAPTYEPPNTAPQPEPQKPNPLKPVGVTPKEIFQIEFTPDRSEEVALLKKIAEERDRTKEIRLLAQISGQMKQIAGQDRSQEQRLLERIARKTDAPALAVLKEISSQMSQMPKQLGRLHSILSQAKTSQTLVQVKETNLLSRILGNLQNLSKKNEREFKALREKRSAEQKQIVRLAQRLDGQVALKSEIVERDAEGRALRVRRTLANGTTQEFNVRHDERGRAESLVSDD